MLLLDEEVDLAIVYDYQLPLVVLVFGEDAVFFFVDGSNKFQGNFVLEMYGEVSQEKYAFLYDPYVGLMNKVLFYRWFHIL